MDDPNADQYTNMWVYQPINTIAEIGYKTKLLKHDVDFQLNIRNVINERAIVYQDSGVSLRPPGGDLSIPYRVATPSRVADYQQPISFIFTTRISL